MNEQLVHTEPVVGSGRVVPDLLYDGGSIDVLYDYHEEAVRWYETNLGWSVRQQESWKPDPRAAQGKMTHMGRGLWLTSSVTSQRLPYHYAERGTVDPHVRLCLRAADLEQTRSALEGRGVRVTDLYAGPGGHRYFDAWLTAEGTRIAFVEEQAPSPVPLPPCGPNEDVCVRIGVSHLDEAVPWYERYIGMQVEAVHREEGYAVMSLGVNHHPDGKSLWILESLPPGAYTGPVDGPVRPTCFVQGRDAFFAYYQFLKDSGVMVGEMGGFTGRGLALFHLYDRDGNRFNVSSFV
ncbi:hypothetical protein J31TS4_31890 [Paenibacillus sp. J31TS4]|uniref:VOC family protein n=1 Tax=Paenibacillus sp. J31TS4 TaxID=2807195 RepID=UPI001B054F3E|nr:VOC family protein [Paenibacillus sp. J31TS4]GIP39909.1 hypothetical protein J31TS4_31890 [Paenibacillus sp. J31TS4]